MQFLPENARVQQNTYGFNPSPFYSISSSFRVSSSVPVIDRAGPSHISFGNEDIAASLPTPLPEIRLPSPPLHLDDPRKCPGIFVEWEPGSVWDTYPYHQHGIRNLLWEPIGFNQWICLRSKVCHLVLPANGYQAAADQ